MSVIAPQAPSQARPAATSSQQQQGLVALMVILAAGVVPTAAALASVAALLELNETILAAVIRQLGRLPAASPQALPDRIAHDENLRRRTLFVINLARRAEQGASVDQLQGQVRLHLVASRARAGAAQQVTQLSQRYGTLVLGWQAIMDAKTTPGCRAANGNNFLVGRPPWIEGSPAYPGWPHGATCRCIAVLPFHDGRLLA